LMRVPLERCVFYVLVRVPLARCVFCVLLRVPLARCVCSSDSERRLDSAGFARNVTFKVCVCACVCVCVLFAQGDVCVCVCYLHRVTSIQCCLKVCEPLEQFRVFYCFTMIFLFYHHQFSINEMSGFMFINCMYLFRGNCVSSQKTT